MKDLANIVGRFNIRQTRGGVLIAEHAGQNLVVASGFALMASLFDGSGTKPSHMGIGASSAATTTDMTALQGTEHERVSGTVSVSDRDYTMTAQFGSGLGGTVTVNEYAIFNASSSGTMIARFIAATLTLDSNDQLDVEWTLTFGDI